MHVILGHSYANQHLINDNNKSMQRNELTRLLKNEGGGEGGVGNCVEHEHTGKHISEQC